MDRLKVTELQDAQLEILMYVHKLCEKLDISYFMAFGSLLGAIRHGGPIPWDADIDIALFRDDYNKLRDYFLGCSNSDYFYADFSTDKNHYSPHAILVAKKSHIRYSNKVKTKYLPKYDGVYIDIFPIDRTSDDRQLQIKQARDLMRVRRIINLKLGVIHENTNFIKRTIKRLVSFLLTPVSFEYLGRRISIIQQRYIGETSDNYVISTDNTCFDRIVPKCFYFPKRITKFGKTDVWIPAKSEEILKQRYANYMEFPPENERWVYLDTVIDGILYE